jgi:SAM-dependent methyltransferase
MILIYLSIILLICYVILHNNKFEGFTNKSDLFINEYKTYRDERIYDEFYSYIYDDLFLTLPYLEEMILTISNTLNGNSDVLCMGSKNGHIVQLLSKDVTVTGLENSKDMIKISNYKYPNNTYLYGNYLDNSLFKDNKFTHILLPMLVLNTIDDINQLFINTNKWLIHNGYFILMTIDLENTPISKLINHKPSSFFKNNFDYEIELNQNNLTDKIKNKKGFERTDIQSLYHHTDDKIIYNAQVNGFAFKYSKKMNTLNGKIMFFQKK